MSENAFNRDPGKQNGQRAVDREVSRLNAIVSGERQQVSWLLWWTIGVWTLWLLLIPTVLVVSYDHAKGDSRRATSQPTTQSVAPRDSASHVPEVLTGTFYVVLFAAVYGLPIAGVILAALLVVSRRTASTNQIRASLATINAHLRLLKAPRFTKGDTK